METIDSKENLIRLVEQYKNLVFSICLKMTGDYFAAEDITQETFLAAFKTEQVIEPAAEKVWLCRIATNKCIDWKREAARRSVPTPEDELPEVSTKTEDGPLHTVLCREIMEKLHEACKSLDSPYREVSELYFEQGLTAKEIAERRGVGLKTVQTQIYRARELLKKKIRKEVLMT